MARAKGMGRGKEMAKNGKMAEPKVKVDKGGMRKKMPLMAADLEAQEVRSSKFKN